MNVLFICKYNRFRSKIAESIFNSINYNKEIEAKSAGIVIDYKRRFIARNTVNGLEVTGYKLKVDNNKPVRISEELTNWADKIVIVADDVSLDLFPKGKTEVWEVQDVQEDDLEKIKKTVKDIEKRVKILIKNKFK